MPWFDERVLLLFVAIAGNEWKMTGGGQAKKVMAIDKQRKHWSRKSQNVLLSFLFVSSEQFATSSRERERERVVHRVKATATATATSWYSVTVFLPLTIMNGFIHYLPHPWPRPSVVMRLIPRGAEGGCHHFKCFWCLAYSVSSSSPSFLLCYMLQCIVRVPPSSGCCLFRFLWCLFLLQAIY